MTEPIWTCSRCGVVSAAEVYRVLSPVDAVHNHRRIAEDTSRPVVHTVTRMRGADPW